jgi:hypothetical protein
MLEHVLSDFVRRGSDWYDSCVCPTLKVYFQLV